MPYAVELALDHAAGAEVRAIWRALEGAGIVDLARSGAEPHVSLGIWAALDLPALEAALATFARGQRPLDVVFASVETFSGGVVYLATEATAAQRDAQAELHRRVACLGTGAWAHYAPGVWVPHCTLAMDLTPAQLTIALALARRAPLPLRARLVRVAIVEFRPVREIRAFDLE
jgi:2'-5' RNA ligase